LLIESAEPLSRRAAFDCIAAAAVQLTNGFASFMAWYTR
jgi:hypothetical protein